MPQALERIDAELNSHSAYGTYTKAVYAKESLEQVLADIDSGEAPEPDCKCGYLPWQTFEHTGKYEYTSQIPGVPGKVCLNCPFLPKNAGNNGNTPCNRWSEKK